jgi:molybdopterin/thiamine biosynthesis adenylyltransferase
VQYIRTKQEKTSQGIKEEEALKELKVLGGLNAEEIQRYGRQMIMKEIGVEGQKKLKESKVIVIGAGGIGSSALLYLAAAGIGTLGTLDYDPVEVSNLHRQIIHSTKTIGVHKAVSERYR